ncbi:hypothetical protein EJ05DRAFT_513531 [Pseudovirgaria hyperparasitica]|uniref:Uncharacterized protein n=1 Tax=Pseudovirgaria hyperparasitica TaxID=470096 RepID=A0A6A6VZC3_9PEZI|nr:uncharacterized protein EJ05DRAFT_513531 [Pseudovirgaria hyperparasitica]KAF2755229.1 hypothetical protein EJ05DRAFT_513531 [Pseudovirgaria hyperparasitica]
MASSTFILKLSNELLRDVLDHIEADPEKLVGLDRRAYLSQESFSIRPPPIPERSQAQDIGNFRLACRRFSELGAIHQFSRVTTRFSRGGLRRLENIAGREHLAKHVKKFSYMVPYFYVKGPPTHSTQHLQIDSTDFAPPAGRERLNELLPNLPESLGALDVSHFVTKATEQREIVETEEDVRVLKKALLAFTSLQHVQILRVQDHEDQMLISYIRQHEHSHQLVELNWAPACSHSTKTLVVALLASRSPCSRFSSPMLSPQSAVVLVERPLQSFSTLAERLTCLELHFDDGNDLDNKMRELSSVFKTVFTAAKNMQAVHVGFPSHRPLGLKLEELFHNVRWEKLVAFGIQSWRLDASEIIAMAKRHRERLKGLRLRDVQLKEGSMWKDVLGYLHDDMLRLDWVSLRRIGYEKTFDAQWSMGAEVPDDPPGGGSDSDDESDTWDPHADLDDDDDNYDDMADDQPQSQTNFDNADQDGDSDSDTSTWESEDGTEAEEGASGDAGMGFPPLSPDTPSSLRWCNCNGHNTYPSSAEELDDDGEIVSNVKRKMWEKWVVRRCFQHSFK